jgi:hypothetical protein
LTYQGVRKAAGRSNPNPAAGGRILAEKLLFCAEMWQEIVNFAPRYKENIR